MRNVTAFFCGGTFGAGLLVAGVTDTRVISGGLDPVSGWNPSLGFFFLGSSLVMIITWKIVRTRTLCALGNSWPSPSRSPVDRDLVAGSLLFGVGWGLAGICPGPSLAALSFGGLSGVTFVASMIAGMTAARFYVRLSRGASWGEINRRATTT